MENVLSLILKGIFILIIATSCFLFARFVAFGYLYSGGDCIYHGPFAQDYGPCVKDEENIDVADDLEIEYNYKFEESIATSDEDYIGYETYKNRKYKIYYLDNWEIKIGDRVQILADSDADLSESITITSLPGSRSLSRSTCSSLSEEIITQVSVAYDTFDIRNDKYIDLNGSEACLFEANFIDNDIRGRYIRYFVKFNSDSAYIVEIKAKTGSENISNLFKSAESFTAI
ncbi:MAG: hypothetical protein Q9M91_01105 [Candidatus Dojkabacteria bacterium]|nr:hypothetical protein [Candidatus Dojkabacteria bacterium]MDQ7020424.1 hypothetical protein [Candidatus Dojkabacteria bacterium]